jgi:chromosome segregation protein
VSRLELQRLEREAQQVVEQRDASLIQTAEKEQARLVQEEALAAARSTLAELQESVRHVSEEHSVLRVELASWDERQRAEKNAQTRLETQLSELTQRREELTGLIGSLGADRGRLLGDNVALDEVAGRLGGEIAGAEAEVERLAVQESALREQEAAAEETLRGLRAEVQVAQERRSQIELVMVERRAELKYLDETAHKELKASLQELAQQGPAEADEITLAEAEEKYQSLKTKIENLGPVNADALQEYEEAQQRYDFLNAQRQDLLDSIRDTEKAIQDIDVESRRRFADAFQAINENFKETFARLFGGGVAEMHLTDPANVNDSGVDIIASPPGKRLQNVLLLSGGEKALTALALLMAIFRYTPSPFCILDEVDAPLDEPNIQRLMTLLRQMAEDTQFIIITHARRTMESASALYGVTMQEPGVSKLVSVRFEGDPPPVARSAAAFAAHA